MTFYEMSLIDGLSKKHREDCTTILWEKSMFYAKFYKVNFSLNALMLKKNTTTNYKGLLEGEIFYPKYQHEEIFMTGLRPP